VVKVREASRGLRSHVKEPEPTNKRRAQARACCLTKQQRLTDPSPAGRTQTSSSGAYCTIVVGSMEREISSRLGSCAGAGGEARPETLPSAALGEVSLRS